MDFTITSFLRVIHYDSLLIYDCLLFWYKNQRQDEQFLSSLKRNLIELINEEEQDRLDSNQDADSTLLANNKNMSMKESSTSESAAFFALGSGLITDVCLQFIIEGNACINVDLRYFFDIYFIHQSCLNTLFGSSRYFISCVTLKPSNRPIYL